jgi:photosystem II stability/assembly factor-like uncharacterized protein
VGRGRDCFILKIIKNKLSKNQNLKIMKKLLLMIAAVMLLNVSLFSQWIPKAVGLLPAGYGIVQMQAVSNSVIYAMATDYAQWMAGSSVSTNTIVYLLKSTDGGDNWSIDSVPGANGFVMLDMMVVNPQTVYFTANNLSNTVRLYYTTDGGSTWNYKIQAQVANSISMFIAAFNSCDFLSFGWGQMVATSADTGNTWTARTTPAMLTGEYIIESSGTNTIAILSNHAWVPTAKGRVFISTDKGVTWSITSTTLYPGRCINTLAFTDTLQGLAGSSLTNTGTVAPSLLARTLDGGLSWGNITSPPRPFANLCALPGLHGAYIAVADTAMIKPGSMYTLDNGNSWTVIDSANYYNSVTFFDPTHGWAGLGKPALNNSPAIYKWGGTPFGINDISMKEQGLKVFPNPASNIITVIVPNKASTEILNIQGQIIRRLEIKDHKTDIDISGFSSGVYIIKATTDNCTTTKLFIKE